MADIDPAPGDSARAITKDAIMITYRQRLALILGQKQRQRSPTFPAVRASIIAAACERAMRNARSETLADYLGSI